MLESGQYHSSEYVEFGESTALLLAAWCGSVEKESSICRIELEGRNYVCPTGYPSNPVGIFNQLFGAVCMNIADRRTCQLLSTPTDKNGEIDPIILVERLPNDPDKLAEDSPCDLILSLYRVASFHRKEAATLLRHYDREYSYIETLRAILEEREEINPQYPEPYRKAFEYDLAWRKNQFPYVYNQVTGALENIPEIRLNDCPERLLYPLSFVLQEMDFHFIEFNWAYAYIQWRLNLCPGIRRFSRWIGMNCLPDFVESVSNADYPNALLDDLLDSRQPLDEIACLLLVPALTSKSTNLSLLAVDIIIATIDDGRFQENLFAAAFEYWLQNDISKPIRWLERFQTISNQSLAHAESIKKLLELMVPSLPAKIQGGFFEYLNELCILLNQKIENVECREFLSQYKGTGKAAKAVKQLLKL